MKYTGLFTSHYVYIWRYLIYSLVSFKFPLTYNYFRAIVITRLTFTETFTLTNTADLKGNI